MAGRHPNQEAHMRKAAPFLAALVAASSIAGTADATATNGSAA